MSTNSPETPTDAQTTDQITISDVERIVREEFDASTWEATEAVLASHVTLHLAGKPGGVGLVLVGPPSSGKTTVLEFFEGLDIVYRSDDVTPASFVSHDASKSEEQLGQIDLLPKVARKSLLSRDMATWFAGEQEDIYKRMSIMAHLLDGNGYTRDTGSHGERGYTGREYRFNFIGATTPLPPSAWQVMGNVGNRLLFHEKRGTSDMSQIVSDVVCGSEYPEKVARCRDAVQTFLTSLWNDCGGFEGIEWTDDPEAEVGPILSYLTELVCRGRAPIIEGRVQPEGGHRIAGSLYDVARGHAILHGRRHVTVEDMQVCARIALSTIPEKRRPLVRALLDPANGGVLTTRDVCDLTGVSKPTAGKRMEEISILRFGSLGEVDGDGRNPKALTLRREYVWPDSLRFPWVES